jgi:hypothetical protein
MVQIAMQMKMHTNIKGLPEEKKSMADFIRTTMMWL